MQSIHATERATWRTVEIAMMIRKPIPNCLISPAIALRPDRLTKYTKRPAPRTAPITPTERMVRLVNLSVTLFIPATLARGGFNCLERDTFKFIRYAYAFRLGS